MFKNLYFKSWLLLLCMIVGVGSAWAEDKTSTLTFTEKCGGSGTADDDASWKVTSDGTESSYDNSKGIHYGTGSAAVQYIKLSTSAISGTISKVVVNASTASSVSATVSVTVGGNAFGGDAQSLSTSATDYTFSGSASGEIIVTVTKPSSATKALYVKSIAVTYSTGGGDTPTLEDCDLALTGAPVALSFDLYNNSTAQVVNYTTSSTGKVTIGESDYATFVIDEVNKTITVTPIAVTPSAQTITVSQAADDTYKAGTATFTVTIIDSTPIPTHTATFSVNGATSTEDFEEGAAITFPEDPDAVYGKSFVGWVTTAIDGTTNDKPAFVTSATMGQADITYYAVFAEVTKGTQVAKTDELTYNAIGVTSSTYSAWSGKTFNSSAEYAGNSAGGNTSIQLRSAYNNSGVVTTATGGKVSKVTLVWNQSTSVDRTLDVYGSNTAYGSASDLYSSSTQGTLIDTFVKESEATDTEHELTIKGDYKYIGFRSASGAMYLKSISITWVTGTPDTYSDYCTTVVAATVEKPQITVDENPFLFSTTATITCATEGAAIKYSFDGETWNDYSEALTITATTTIYAKAVKGEDESTVAQVTATKNLAEPTVTIDATGITNTNVFDGTAAGSLLANVTYNDEAIEGAEVTWSGNNDAVATIDEDGVVTLVAAGSVTFTATYAGNGDYSEKAATYEMTVTNTDPNAPGTENNPYTVAEAIAFINTLGSSTSTEEVYVDGIISQIDSYNSKYSSITYWISDDGTTTNQMEVYSGKGLNGADFSSQADLSVGDIVTVKGYVKMYNTTPEFTQNNQLVNHTEKSASDLAKKNDITLDFKNDNTMADLTEYFTTTSSGAITYTVADETVIEREDEIISALKEGTTTVTVSQAATLSYKAGEITINVTVADSRVDATTIPAINISTLKVGAADGTISVVDPVKADEGVTFSYVSSNEDVLLIDGDTYTVGKIGTTTVTVTATTSDSKLYKSVVANFEVTVEAATKIDNVIVIAESGSAVYGTPLAVDYAVEDDYDGTLTYIIDNNAIADVAIGADAITFTPKAVGTAVITISAPATANFNAAEDVEYTLTVTAPAAKDLAPESSTLFNETFDKCAGTGGRDNTFTGSVGTSSTTGLLDESWATIGSNGASQCIKLGTGSKTGTVTTSDIELTGSATLTFSAAGWGDTSTNTVQVTAEGATLSGDVDVTMTNGEWNSYTVNITEATGTVAITFTMKRGFLDDVKVFSGAPAPKVTLAESGYATYCCEYPLDLSKLDKSVARAWYVSEVSGTTVTFKEIKGTIKEGTPFILYGTPSAKVELAYGETVEKISGNQLEGTLAPTYVASDEDITYFGLSGGSFAKINTGVVPANKAYLPVLTADLPSGGEARLMITFDDGTTTGIVNLNTVSDNRYYNLRGQRVENPVKGGLYIVNGRKVVVK